MKHRILIIDDDPDMCRLLERLFARNNFEVNTTGLGKKALEEMEKNPPDVILCDFRLTDIEGMELIQKSKKVLPQVPIIIITAFTDVKAAVEVMKNGAFDFITKPSPPEDILDTVLNAIKLKWTPQSLQPVVNGAFSHGDNLVKRRPQKRMYIFGDSPEFKQILLQINVVAPTNYSVIISGESGSGKEVIAQEIHARSKRNSAPFIAIDCGALSNELAASELFGHEKGSFTGATNQKIGSLELANTGTVFLDEITNLSYDIQVSLLRVVQERKLRRVGGTKDIDLDIRIIVASNERLAEAVEQGRFREDLFYRFNEFNIYVPPLRERENDILTFANFFLEQCNEDLEKNIKGFSPEVEHLFKTYHWPGNLRQLKNVVKRATLLADDACINANTLPQEILIQNEGTIRNLNTLFPTRITENNLLNDQLNVLDQEHLQLAKKETVKPQKHDLKSASISAEYEMIIEALKKSNFNKSKAAKLLNVDRKTLYNKMKLHRKYKSNSSGSL